MACPAFSTESSGTTRLSKICRHRAIYDSAQQKILEDFFRQKRFPDFEEKEDSAQGLDGNVDRVAVWFCNKRAKQKKKGECTGSGGDANLVVAQNLSPTGHDVVPPLILPPQDNWEPAMAGQQEPMNGSFPEALLVSSQIPPQEMIWNWGYQEPPNGPFPKPLTCSPRF